MSKSTSKHKDVFVVKTFDKGVETTKLIPQSGESRGQIVNKKVVYG